MEIQSVLTQEETGISNPSCLRRPQGDPIRLDSRGNWHIWPIGLASKDNVEIRGGPLTSKRPFSRPKSVHNVQICRCDRRIAMNYGHNFRSEYKCISSFWT